MPKVGGRRKKSRTHKETTDNEETSTGQKIPKTFIVKRGDIPNPLKVIIGDMREVMYPHTAMNLRESSKNRLKDYLSMSSGFGVTHMLLFSATSSSNYLRFVKLPDGPTITFKILNYSSHKDILGSQKKRMIFGRTLASPLLILNGFNNIIENHKTIQENRPTANHYNLVYLMLQKMFPQLDLVKAKIHNTKKTVLLNLDQEKDVIEFRYYGLRTSNTGINKNIKQLLEAKTVPNLKGFKDISDFVLRENDYMSENEVEDNLDEDFKSKSGEKKSNKMTVKLHEIGPRLTLKLIKIEEGLLKGNVVYHRLVQKTPEEIEENRKRLREKAKLKEKLKQQQEEAVNQKKSKIQKKEELRRKKQFLEETKEEEEGDDGEEYDKEAEDEVGLKEPKTKEKTLLKKRPFDLSKNTRSDVENDDDDNDDEDSEGDGDNVGEDDEVQDFDELEDDGDNLPDDIDEYD